MSSGIESDPSFWKWAAGALMALIGTPMAFLWRKVVGAAAKEELATAITNAAKSREQLASLIAAHAQEHKEDLKEVRDTMKVLFTNAETDRRRVNENLSKLHSDVHDSKVDLMDRITRAVQEMKGPH